MAKFKLGLLLCLVFISILLAIQIMYRALPGGAVQYEDVWFGHEPDTHEVSRPSRIYIIATGNVQLVASFSQTYNDLITVLEQIDTASRLEEEVWEPVEYRVPPLEEELNPGIIFRFDFPVSSDLLASWLPNFDEYDLPFETVDTIFVPAARGNVEFINSATHQTWALHAEMPWQTIDLIVSDPSDTLGPKWKVMESGENYSVAPGVFEISGPAVLQAPRWAREELNYNALVRSFYLEPGITRLIQEPDGAEIYTDGFQALRIYASGSLEYSVVKYQAGSFTPDQIGLVETSISFTTSHGGWPGEMLVTYINNSPGSNLRVELSNFASGLALLGQTGITIELDGLAVSHYSREVIYVDGFDPEHYFEIKALSKILADPLTQAAQFIATVDNEITDLALAYYWNQEELIPVWRVWVGGQVVIVGAENGRIISVTPRGGE